MPDSKRGRAGAKAETGKVKPKKAEPKKPAARVAPASAAASARASKAAEASGAAAATSAAASAAVSAIASASVAASTKTPPAASAAPAAPSTADVSVLALQLLGRWQRVCNGHVAFANACACVFGAAVELSDFDDLIIDYLCNKFADQPDVTAYIEATAVPAPGAPGTLRTLLRKIAAAPGEAPEGQAMAILRTLETSVASIEEQHAK